MGEGAKEKLSVQDWGSEGELLTCQPTEGGVVSEMRDGARERLLQPGC